MLDASPYSVSPSPPPVSPAEIGELRQIEAFSRQLSGSLDLDTVLALLADAIQSLLYADRCAIFLYDAVSDLACCALARGLSQEYTKAIDEQFRRLPGGALIEERFQVVQDALVDPRMAPVRNHIRREGFRSMLLVGLRYQDAAVGALGAYYDEVVKFDQHHLFLAQTLANQAAVAVRNAQHFAESQQRVAELEALRRTSLLLASSLDTTALIEAIATSVMKLVDPTVVHLYLHDPHGERLSLGTALWSTGEREPAVAAPRDGGITNQGLKSREPIIINDALNHPLYGLNESAKVRAWGIRAIGSFPLLRPSGVMGVFTVSFARPFRFSDSVASLLSLFADQAAVALENARLFEAAKRRAQETEHLKDFNESLLRSVEAGILLEDIGDRIAYVNPRLCEIVGRPAEDLLGQDSGVLLTP
ncbi:MAG: GAF domain-containing protein, partial [Anaerolineae bacterium]